MGLILGVLIAVFITGGIISGVLYSRQQAAEHRERQFKAAYQKYEEHLELYDALFQADDQVEVPTILNKALLELAKELRRLNPQADRINALVELHSTQDAAFRDGELKPRGELAVSSDTLLRSRLSHYADATQKLQRLKVRGQIAQHQYEEAALHLRHLSLETEVQSHIALGDLLVEKTERLNAESHLKHARECLKKSGLNIEGKAERIRELSDRIKNLDAEIRAIQEENPPSEAP